MPVRPRHQQRTEHGAHSPVEIQQAYGRRAGTGRDFRNHQIVGGDDETQAQPIHGDRYHSQPGRSQVERGHARGHQQQSGKKCRTESQPRQQDAGDLHARERGQELHQEKTAGLRVVERPARDQDGQHRAQQSGQDAGGEKGDLGGQDQLPVRPGLGMLMLRARHAGSSRSQTRFREQSSIA